MKLHLIDDDPIVADALRSAFAAHVEVDVGCGDILRVASNTIVSPANSFGHMDGGIDRLYADFFGPALQRRVYDVIGRQPEGHLPVGASVLIRTGHDRIPNMIVAPTVYLPEPVSSANAYHAMVAILRCAKRWSDRVFDIYCPGLTTGVGEVDPKGASLAMAEAYATWVEREGALSTYPTAQPN